MPRTFDVPSFYRSPTISLVKRARQALDPRKKDLSPTLLDFGPVQFKLGRHFGFCFGVENAIEIAYRAIGENKGRRIFLLSEMIHNPEVNQDLRDHGVGFLMETNGHPKIPFSELRSDDIVIVPAFGTTLELQQQLTSIGIDPYFYDTTCPFVEKVWKRSAELGRNGYSVIIHGKRIHEETRATFSHSKETAPTIVVRDMEDTEFLVSFLHGNIPLADFLAHFAGAMSNNFDPHQHLLRVGVVNQTTMLATETQAIAQKIKNALIARFGLEQIKEHFADTRDTLCYATNENQDATRSLIEAGGDLALVVGGYNSSNTSHLVELCEQAMPTFYIKDCSEILGSDRIRHFDMHQKSLRVTSSWLPQKTPVCIALTSGASCPDSTVDLVLQRILAFFPKASPYEQAFEQYANIVA